MRIYLVGIDRVVDGVPDTTYIRAVTLTPEIALRQALEHAIRLGWRVVSLGPAMPQDE